MDVQGTSSAEPWLGTPWTARWIWAEVGDAGSQRHSVAFRTRLPVPPHDPASASWARVFAHGRYRVWINGEEVAHGPMRGNPTFGHYDIIDLGSSITSGDNEVAALVTCDRHPTPWSMPPPEFANDLVGGAFVLDGEVGGRRFGTDASWRAQLLDGWTSTPGHGVSGRGVETVRADAVPDEWTTAPVDWPAAVVRRGQTAGEPGDHGPPSYPFGPYGPRPMTTPSPSDVSLAPSGASWLADRVEVGTLVVDAEGPSGATVTLRASERCADGSPVPDPEHDAIFTVELDGGRRVMESVDSYGFSGLGVEADGGAVVHTVHVRNRSYPVVGDSVFRCSDDLLAHVWAAGRRSVTLNSADAYTDCPTREQRAWTGDAVVHQLVDLTTNADWGLARAYPAMAAASARPDGMLPMAVAGDVEHFNFTVIPDWALHWVHAVHNLWRYVGDEAEIRALLPAVERVVRWFDRFDPGTGVPTDVTGWVIIDWAAVHTTGASAALCGLLGRALTEFAAMASWCGDEGRVQWARTRHAALSAGFEAFWDPDRQWYVDSLVDGQRRPMTSQHAQAAAIVGGLAPHHRHARLVEVLGDTDRRVWAAFRSPDGPCPPNAELPLLGDHLRRGHPDPWWDVDNQVVGAQPFFRYVVHDALAAAGRADLIVDACRDWRWALERCPTSLTETWYGGTVSHGWGATPTRDMMTRVLGVEPDEPGFGVARVGPALGDLTWAEGRVPCPTGMIDLRAEAHSNGTVAVALTSPIPCRVGRTALPAGNHSLTLGPDGNPTS